MDTPPPKDPDINPSFIKLEDSPLYKFLNTLSPINPNNPIHAPAMQNHIFSSIPSVFTTPQPNFNKESRFLRRHQFPDPLKPEISFEKENKSETSEGVMNSESSGNATYNPPEKSDYGRLEPHEVAAVSSSLTIFNVDDYFDEDEFDEIEPNKDGSGGGWLNMMLNDGPDLPIFDEANGFESHGPHTVDHGPTLHNSLDSQYPCDSINDVQRLEVAAPVAFSEPYEIEGPSTQPIEDRETNENYYIGQESSEKINEESVLNLHRGMRRRCLDFELPRVRTNKVADSNCSSSSCASDEKTGPVIGGPTPRCILPGIGLHLNGLASASAPTIFTFVKQENYTLINLPALTGPFNSSSTGGLPPLNTSLAVIPLQKDMGGPCENELQVAEGAFQAAPDVVTEELNPGSPKKKRRRSDNVGEVVGCKRCSCKKSKCLKLYCECFAAGIYCIEPCSCVGCFNQPNQLATIIATRKQIESRNPLAFTPKVIRAPESVPEIGDELSKTPASARHKRGCNCKKSSCLKKYCECYQGGVGCSVNCRCESCKNVFGRKDGSPAAEIEAYHQEETEPSEQNLVDPNLQRAIVVHNDQENFNSVLPQTPLQVRRPLAELPLSSHNKRPRSSILTIGSSSGLHTSNILRNTSFVRSQPKFEKHIEMSQEEQMPENLVNNASPISSVKSGSPNRKRMSPRNCEFSPGTVQKFRLHSIPSFPSLTTHQ